MIGDAKVPMLIAQTGPAAGQRWALTKAALTIGRDAECDIVIPDRQVSRVHATLHQTAEGFDLEDLGSKNGTHINGQPIHGRVSLQDGDLIQVALVARLAYIGSETTVPLPAGTPLAQLMRSRGTAPLASGHLRLDRAARRLWIGDRELDPPLSAPQFRFLELLYQHPGEVCSREAVIETVWPEAVGAGVSEQAIDALVRRLRDRLAELDPDTQYVATVRGHGFRLDNAGE